MAAHQQQTVPEHDPWTGPPKDGLYDPQLEKEACGVGFIVAIDGKRSNKVSMWVTGRFSYYHYYLIPRISNVTFVERMVGYHAFAAGEGLLYIDTADVVQRRIPSDSGHAYLPHPR